MSRIHTFCLLIAHFLAIFFINPNFAQTGNEINVSIAITPPYSPYLSDYINFEGAILMLQNNTSLTQNIVLRGLIEGDNGLFAETKEDYLPPQPIQLGGFESISFFSGSPEFDFMSINNIETNVSSELQGSTWRTGVLPEGNYSICVRAFDYATGAAISQPIPSGCTTITITYPQPPVIVNPQCGTEVQVLLPTFNWTPPAGNIVGADILYDLYILKLQPGFQGTQDPYYAMQLAVDYNAGNPLVIRNLQITNYQYSPGDPPMVQDATYAVQVIARDANENIIIENEGKSDVCTFVWKGAQLPVDPENITTVAPDPGLIDISEFPVQLFAMTSLSGRMYYKFNPLGTGLGALTPFQQIEQNYQSNFSHVASSTPQFFFDNLNLLSTIPAAPYPEGSQYFDHDLISLSSSDNYLAWTKIRLVTRYITQNGLISKNSTFIFSSGNPIAVPQDNGQVLSVTTTDADGNYNFNFVQGVTGNVGGDLYRVITLEVMSPYFCSPDIKILSLPGDNIQLPDQAALVRTYNLNVNLRRDQTPNQIGGQGTAIGGVEVKVNGNYFFCEEPISINQIQTTQTTPNNLGTYVSSSDINETRETDVNGWVSFTGLVRHNINEVNDRLLVTAKTEMENESGYIGKPIFEFYPESITSSMNDLEPWAEFVSDNPIFNSEREVENYDLFLEMTPDNPKIFGRVMFDAVPLEGVSVTLVAGDLGLDGDISDKDGYFLFNQVLAGASLRLVFNKPGFATSVHHVGIMQMGQYLYYEHQMPYPGDVYGYVQNEGGDPIMADVKLGEGNYQPYIFTEIVSQTEIQTIGTATGTKKIKVTVQKARFQAPAYEGQNIPLEILPRSDKYFPHTFSLDIANLNKDKPTYIGDFTMYEKLHRIRFRVVSELTNALIGYTAIANAKVEIKEQDLSKYTDSSGEAYFKYASPGSYFWVKVTPPVGSDYTPFYEKMHLPVTKYDSIHTIVLSKGYAINGIVTAGQDSFLLSGARVFIKSDISNGQEFTPLIQTYSNADGTFELRGIPTSPTLHSIYAVKSSPDTAFVGNFVMVSENTSSPVHIHLDIADGLNLSEIWELPVEVEDLYNQDNKLFITGAFVNVPDNANFQKTESDLRLSFYNIGVVPSSRKDKNGNLYLEPNGNNVPLGLLSVPVKIHNHFFGEVVSHTSIPQSGNADELLIKVLKDNYSRGYMKGIASMDLSSFKFSYNYSSNISLANDSLDFKISIFKANPNAYPAMSFHIGEATATGLQDLSYDVHEFEATADRTNSLIFEDTVKLSTVLHTEVPNCIPNDLEINAGYIKIIPSDILEFYGGTSLSFKLEEWDVIGKEPWHYDKNQGGIVLPEARINTSVIDLDIENLLIKPDDLKLDNSDLSGKINLAGVTSVNLKPGTKTIFHFDNNCSSDFSPHWRFSVMPISQTSEDPVGEIAGLPGIGSQKIEVGKFSLFSNDETQMDQFDQTVTFYEVFDLKLDGNALSTYPNSFELHGTYNLNIPNLSSNYQAILQFSKPGSQIEMNLLPPYLEFQTIGNVKFKADQTQNAFNFSNGLFEAIGTITITDNGVDVPLKGKLTRSVNEIKVDIIQVNNENQVISFSGHPDKYLEVMEGKMEVVGTQWEKLWFDGAIVGMGDGIKDPYNNLLHFIAHGDVNVDNGSVEVTGVETPFGSIAITFDFMKMALHGSLSINTPIATGYCTFVKGAGELQVDGDGFYFGLGLTIHIISIPIDIDAAVIVGYYPTFDIHLQNLLNEYSYRNEMPAVFNGGVEGFLFSLTINAISVHEGIDLGIAAFNVDVDVGANYIVYATFNDPPAFGMELMIFAGLTVEFSFICVDLGLTIMAELLVGGSIVNGEVDLFGCGYLMVGIYYDVCELVSGCLKESVRMDLRWGTSTGGDLDADVTLGGESCSGNSGFSSNHTPCD